MSRAWQAFLTTQPPSITHNALHIQWRYKDGSKVPFIAKKESLRKAEDDLAAYVARAAVGCDVLPLRGPLRETVKFMWAPHGDHAEGTPRIVKPDLDNLCKTLNDVLERQKVIADDAHVVDLRLVKAYATPPGIFVRIEEIR